jgi:hypothetical protein
MTKLLAAIRKWLKVTWDNTDNIAKWAQILALGVAAYWTYTRFLIGEAPSLEPRVIARADYKIFPGPTEGTCHLQAHIFVSNEGKTSFDVNTVHLEVFRNPLPEATPDIRDPFDETNFERTQNSLSHGDLQLPTLLHHYAPGRQSDQTVSWFIKKQSNQIYLFKINVGATDRSGHDLSAADTRFWEWGMCTGSDKTPWKTDATGASVDKPKGE